MPQLAFTKEDTPKRISASLTWDQIRDEWSTTVVCYSQSDAVQQAFSGLIPGECNLIEVGLLFEQLIEDWIATTPSYAIAHFGKGLRFLDPPELPAGLDLHEALDRRGNVVGRLPRYQRKVMRPEFT